MRRRAVAIFLACVLGLSAAGSTSASSRTGDIEGTVSHHGKAVANAAVSAAGQTVRTDDHGRFRFLPVAVSGDYTLAEVVVRAPGLGKWTLADARVMPNDTLRVTADLEKQDVSIRQPKPRTSSVTSPDSLYSTTATDTYTAASYSTTTPPSTIRVYVTGSKYCNPYASGTVKVVDFKQYVKHVLPNEWMPYWHGQSLRAGAMAAKSFAWHYINLGGKWPGLGADLMDSTCDQVYTPAVSYASTDLAVDDTWGYRITKDGGIHICQYWGGVRRRRHQAWRHVRWENEPVGQPVLGEQRQELAVDTGVLLRRHAPVLHKHHLHQCKLRCHDKRRCSLHALLLCEGICAGPHRHDARASLQQLGDLIRSAKRRSHVRVHQFPKLVALEQYVWWLDAERHARSVCPVAGLDREVDRCEERLHSARHLRSQRHNTVTQVSNWKQPTAR